MEKDDELYSLKPSLIEKISFMNSHELSPKAKAKYIIGSVSKNVRDKHDKAFNFWIEGYGCSANYSDMEIMSGILKQNGFNQADGPENADVTLIVTCSVKNSTEHKMINRIKSLTKTNKPLIIAGCLPAANERMVRSLSPSASLLGPDSIPSIAEVTLATLQQRSVTELNKTNEEKINLPKVRINPVISIIQISTGCLSECTFCQTKLAKGNLRSFRTGNIINQIKTDVEAGAKEIWLTSTDNGCYGLDIGTNIGNLLRSCEQIDMYFRIRLGMLNPMYLKNLDKEITNIYMSSNKLFKFIHIPIQSGSVSILKKMKRGHTLNSVLDLTDRLKNNIPEITIATDVITGFPTETDKDFEETLKVIKHIEPDIVNSSKFSSRPGTAASKMERVNDKIISYRSKLLHKLIKSIALRKNSKWKGWKGEILIDDIENGILKGRNDYYKSIALREDPNNILEQEDNLIRKVGKVRKKNIDIRHTQLENSCLFNSAHMGQRMIVKVVSHSNHTLNAIPLELVN
ncbi:tRNA (N(6)-L-threonylcarbamoyladenosine(37)-C(2))-methylthiotransferase [Candidatus Nitrosocosmicus franklandus]|uniref:tRNA-t(6)A37 methylthiotransferase n=1 Tax=Candidatus Nitrosocosmicus franklandianus TaxID=1798806 RepID=A0A484IH46_9ARCH|nr:tRNA (N(6)-L-threonylcarbamoyladenosine(37)-C(2))-methylthiotransferase [Candidatus Nitrosocosmicus franklandus]VFJ15352.1 (Dimethylallyl)adenosine tRNA methylthiotransferase MiaB [Candidatus Nitrosocosmicus franklandus]